MTTISGALVSILNMEGKTQEQFLSALDRQLLARSFEYAGPRRDWNRAYVFGERKSGTLALRVQRRKNDTWLLARPSYRSAAGSLLGMLLGFLLEIIILLVVAFVAPSLIRDNVLPSVVLSFGALFLIWFTYARSRRRMMRELPAMRAAYREARDAAFDQVGASVRIREVRSAFNYIESVKFEEDHPEKTYLGNTYDTVALVLGLILPALAGIYLLLRREGGWLRLGYSLLLSMLYAFTVYRFLLQGYYPGAAPAFIFTIILLRLLVWVPVYQCGNCGRQGIYHLTPKCPQCKTNL